MFCNRCGTKLPDNALFCHVCGADVHSDQAPHFPPGFVPKRPRPKWLIPLIAGISALVTLGVMLAAIFIGSRIWQGLVTGVSGGEVPPIMGAWSFRHYENSNVKFSLDYPTDFAISEPLGNGVLLEWGTDCRIEVKYGCLTPNGTFVYSGGDFVEQISADPHILEDYVTDGAINQTGTSAGSFHGQDWFCYSWTLTRDAKDYEGELYVFDSQGEFGCYTIMTLINVEKANLFRERVNWIVESFRITEAHQSAGYSIHTPEGMHLRFAVDDSSIQGGIEVSDGSICIYPHAGVFSESNLVIKKSSFTPDRYTPEDCLRGVTNSYFMTYKGNAQYTSSFSSEDLGRYPYKGVDLEYTDGDEWFVVYVFVFPYEDAYWQITLESTEEYLEDTAFVLFDVLSSLVFTGETL